MVDLLDHMGGQFELSIFEFADKLSKLKTWGLKHCHYGTFDTEPVNLKSDLLVAVTTKAKMTKIYKQLLNLEFVNEKREYALFIANPNAPEDEWASITFTRDSVHSFLVETY